MRPNRAIGIIGGGQLARMLAIAAAELGFKVNIYCPDRDCPAAQVANTAVLGNYDDSEKLVAFASPLFDIEGTSLFLDLDVVIVDNIDCFFTHMPEKEFIIIKDWDQKDITGNSSVFRYQVNRHPDVLDRVINNFDAVSSRFRDEQSYLTDHMHAKGCLQYWPYEWCVRFKYHCIPRGIRSWFQETVLPPKAKIVVFNCMPKPPDAIVGRSGRWYRKFLPAKWVAVHWK